jgi:hypothetical protein
MPPVFTPPNSGLFTREQAAAYLGIKAQTLAVWACTRRYNLPIVRIGHGIIRYRKSDLDAFIDAHAEAAPAAG